MDVDGSGCGQIKATIFDVFLEGRMETMKILNQESQWPGRNSNWAPRKHVWEAAQLYY
jgi:hypothetical protein